MTSVIMTTMVRTSIDEETNTNKDDDSGNKL